MSQKNTPVKNENEEITRRATRYLEKNEELLRKYRLTIRLVVNFPTKSKTPLLSKVALWIVSKQKGRIDLQFIEPQK